MWFFLLIIFGILEFWNFGIFIFHFWNFLNMRFRRRLGLAPIQACHVDRPKTKLNLSHNSVFIFIFIICEPQHLVVRWWITKHKTKPKKKRWSRSSQIVEKSFLVCENCWKVRFIGKQLSKHVELMENCWKSKLFIGG